MQRDTKQRVIFSSTLIPRLLVVVQVLITAQLFAEGDRIHWRTRHFSKDVIAGPWRLEEGHEDDCWAEPQRYEVAVPEFAFVGRQGVSREVNRVVLKQAKHEIRYDERLRADAGCTHVGKSHQKRFSAECGVSLAGQSFVSIDCIAQGDISVWPFAVNILIRDEHAASLKIDDVLVVPAESRQKFWDVATERAMTVYIKKYEESGAAKRGGLPLEVVRQAFQSFRFTDRALVMTFGTRWWRVEADIPYSEAKMYLKPSVFSEVGYK
ncbi:MAG TPA: hypothetical protein VHL58_14970 [Thermoanaerobaculia bacterium]|nr:hypothetical protein [Thermoanaerobaculia bacterium]